MSKQGKRKGRLGAWVLALAMVVPCFGAFSALSETVAPEQTTAQAAANYGTIRVRVTVANNLTSYSFKLAGNYQLAEKPSVQLPDGNYTVTSNGSTLTLKLPNGTSQTIGSQITLIECQNTTKSFITMTGTHADTQRYRGDVIFYIDSGIRVVNRVPMETYLVGVIRGEMGAGFPLEALKAQTVAARGYAIKRLQANTGIHYDITDTASDQVYRGYVANETSEEAVLQAVEQTRGKVLTYGGSIITAYYGATNGGQTELAGNAWSNNLPYLKQKDDSYDLRYKGKEQLLFVPSNIVGTQYDVNGGGAGERVRIDGDNVNIRKGPGTNYNSLGQVNTGTILPYLGTENGWYKVTYNGQTAYVSSTYAEYLAASGSDLSLPYEYDQLHMQDLQKLAYEYLKAKGYNVPTQTNVRLLACNYLKGKDKFYPGTDSRCYRTGEASLKVQYIDGSGVLHDNIDNVVVTVDLMIKTVDENGKTSWLIHPYFNGAYRMRGAEAGTENGVSGYYWTNRRYGHGVGMSQRGAQYRALAGQKYDQILAFYYDGATLTTVDTSAPDLIDQGGQMVVRVVNATTNVNIRAQANINATILGKAQTGDTYPYLGMENGWFKISYNGQTAYISGDYGQLEGAVEVVEPGILGIQVVNVEKAAPVQQSAGNDATTIASARLNTTHQYLATVGDWYKILAGKQIGYIHKNYAKTFTSLPTLTPEPDVQPMTSGYGVQIVNVPSSVVVRASATHESDAIATAKLGTTHEYLGYQDHWYKVNVSGKIGYIEACFGQAYTQPNVKPSDTMGIQVTNVDTYALVQEGPSEQSQTLKAVYKNTTHQYLGADGDWYKILAGKEVGYIHKDYARPFATMPDVTDVPETVQPATSGYGVKIVNVPTSVAVRQTPERDGKIIETLALGTSHQYLGYADGYYKIQANDEVGYLLACFGQAYEDPNKPTPTPTPTPSPSPTPTPGENIMGIQVTNVDTYALVQEGPSEDAQTLKAVYKNTTHQYLGTDGDWYKILAGKEVGYIHKDYARPFATMPDVTDVPDTIQPATSGYGVWIVNVPTSVAVRQTPERDGKIIKTLALGTSHQYLGYADGYYKILANDKVGYLLACFGQAYENPNQPSRYVGVEIVNCQHNVNIRSGPGLNYDVIGQADLGTTHEYYATEGDWYRINFHGQVGYVRNDYAKPFS